MNTFRRFFLPFVAFLMLIVAASGCACGHAKAPSDKTLYTSNAHESGYAASVSVPVWTDFRLKADTKYAVEYALNEWNIALNGHEVFQYQGDLTPDNIDAVKAIVMSDYPSLLFVQEKFEDQDGTELGYVSPKNISIVHLIDDLPTMTVGAMHVVALHEIGHSLGLFIHMPGTLMAPYASQNNAACIDHETARVLALVRGWNPNTMNWCLHVGQL